MINEVFTTIMIVTVITGYSFAHPIEKQFNAETKNVIASVVVSTPSPVFVPAKKTQTVEEIVGIVFGDKKDQALKVAFCESSLNPNAQQTKSTAKGLYQIIKGTWGHFDCTGNPLDAMDNTKCAKRIYDYYGGWSNKGGWAASYHCHKLK